MDPREVDAELYRSFASGCDKRQARILATLDAGNSGAMPTREALELIAVELHDHIGDAQLIDLSRVSAAAVELEQLVRCWKALLLPGKRAGSIDEGLLRSVYSQTFRGWLERLTAVSKQFVQSMGDAGQVSAIEQLRGEIAEALAKYDADRGEDGRDTAPFALPVQKQIVVLDDSSISRKMVAATLEHLGHRVRTAANTDQFWQLMEQLPDAVFVDMNMPDIRGDELCQQLRRDERFAKLPIIIFSSLADEQLQAICTRVGASGYVSKQHGLKTLQRYVHQLVEQGVL